MCDIKIGITIITHTYLASVSKNPSSSTGAGKFLLIPTDSIAIVENSPASTFKIINMLIALETKTIDDENTVVKWPGTTIWFIPCTN
ncbi:hypothetical protein JVX97_19050 [Sphingobacterium siyangense]|nr:hypothetical protein JVX97_19050 [Sphingobacterium siyangense]